LLGGVLLSIAHLVLQLVINFGLIYGLRALPAFLIYKYYVLLSNFLVGLVVYGLILAVGVALNYYGQYRQEELRASQLEAQLAQSQLQALKMQLHPHFLFNTLNSISALQLVDLRAAQKMMARLGDFLRMTLDNVGAQEVTLKEEIEFLRCYLEIEHTRFDKRLTTRLLIAPDTLDAKVPNLILQPIVENAIRHGIAPRLAPGIISISAQRENGLLRMQVVDNGEGLTENTGNKAGPAEGLGLANTRSRLQHLYGSKARLHLANAREGGLVVTLEIPFILSTTEN
jgi:sensor histidine kinase YesM